MTPALKISQKIINRLAQLQDNSLGKLYGILSKNNVVVLGLQLDVENGTGHSLINSFPAEIYLCGVIAIGDENYNEQSVKDRLGEVYVTDNPLFVDYNTATNQIAASFYINSQLETTKFSIISEQEILSQFVYLRLKGDIPITCELSENAVNDTLTNLRKNIASGVMIFNFDKSSIYLLGGDSENGVIGITPNSTVGELCDESNEPSEGGARKKKMQCFEVEVMRVNLLKNVTRESGKEHAPLCVLDKKQCRTLSMSTVIDALALVSRKNKIADLYEIIVESAVRNLRLLEDTIVRNLKSGDCISKPEVFHFYPDACDHFVARIYLNNHSDDDLLEERRVLHRELVLEQTRPVFRRANRFVFKAKNPTSEPLINPHTGVKLTDNGGRVALVKGKYTYYHYCQNKMDDNGWGCAYRSLQTLASWFKHQGYTDKEVPTFNDIQKCLVDIGDKLPNFVGSKQWIGSTEVSFVLNTLLGVESKILYVSSGEEMATKGPELVSHFENHGSPVMIGGGVLAHTILGVDYNSQSGNLRFLILDPHYTGGEDLYTIVNKGWCGWKNVDFWDKTAYYNMCLPQVTRVI